jgi:cbb3-type cytochrome oxidase subunit 3
MIDFLDEWGLLIFSLVVFINLVLKLFVFRKRSKSPYSYKPNPEVERLLNP